MNILFISIASPPKSGAESLQVGKYLHELSLNSDVTLITTPALDVGWKKKDSTQNNKVQSVKKIIQLKTLNNLGRLSGYVARKILKPVLHKPDSDFFFHWQADKIIKLIDQIPDVIYSRSTPFSSAILANKLKRKLNKPWWMHISDPWSDSPYGNYTNNFNIKSERVCFEHADRISFTTHETKSFYKTKYPMLASKFFVSPNVFDNSEIDLNPDVFVNKKLTILHSGNLYGKRNIQDLLESLQLLSKEELDLIELQLAGNLDHHNLAMIQASGLKNVKVLGFLPAAESYELQRKADILLSIDKPLEQKIDKVFLPSKIQDYIAARKTILAITGEGSATACTVKDKYGYAFDHRNKEEIADFLKRALKSFQNKDRDFFIKEIPGNEFETSYNVNLLRGEFIHLMV